jgi:hypothetical protein
MRRIRQHAKAGVLSAAAVAVGLVAGLVLG